MATTGEIRIGISGWRYKGWRGTFYPEKLVQRRELEFASRQFNSIELNGSFYSLHSPESFKKWYDDTPDDFRFAVKGSRYITHIRRLREIETPLANFLAQGLLRLDDKLGPILWQFPPSFKFQENLFADFCALLPKTYQEAVEFAQEHKDLSNQQSWLQVPSDRHLRHTIEIRNESFVCEEFIAILRKHQIGLVVADTVEWPLLMDVTADFVYCRLHGSEQLYASGYTEKALQQWSHRVMAWANGGEVEDGRKASSKNAPKQKSRDVFVYFDNDMKVRAPFDAKKLSQRIAHLMAP